MPERREHVEIGLRTGDQRFVGARRAARDAVEPDVLQSRMRPGVEEAAMRGGDHRLAMNRFRDREIIEEEIYRMDMDQIGVAHMGQSLRGERIAGGAAKRQSYDLDAAARLARRQRAARIGENAVERRHAHIMAGANLRFRKPGDDFLDAA